MVGILTMASPVEDYGIRPCKKQRKDDDPPVKTITNYFSPLAKSVAKVFSPKSNNIRDYFKSTQPTKENVCTPGTSEICDNVMTVNTLKDPQSPVTISQKARKRKRQRKKVDLQSIQGDGEFSDNPQTVTITSDDSHQSQDVGSTCMNVSFIGSDTAALLAQICNENEVSETGEQLTNLSTSTSNDCKKKAIKPSQQKKGRSRSMTWKRKFEDSETSSATKSVEYVSDKPEKEEATKSDSTERLSSSLIQSGSSCTNSSLEVHADETSVLHTDSVVTVSFEDFLKSHTDAGQAFDAEPSVLENSVSENHADESASGAERSGNTPLSAKALTVQVQVHSSSPKAFNQLKLNKSGKTIASIFLRKNSEPEIECESIYMDEPSEKLNVKRKSNVVIEEEDLELAVLEVGASEWVKPKSTAEERQQFMKAFRQPSSDAGKPSAKKTNKLHDVNEKSLIEKGKVDEGSDKESNKLGKANKKASKEISFEPNIQQCNTGEGKIKKLRKRRTNVEQANDAKSAPSVQNKVETKHMNNTVPKADNPNDNLNKEASPILEKHPIVLRRSSRQRSSDGSQINSPIISPVADAVASDTAQGDGYSQILTPKGLHQAPSGNPDGPVEASTPKMSRRPLRKTSRYKSEMILSPEVHSPIRMRFTRLYRSRKNDSLAEDAVFTPRSNKKVTSSTKTVSEAKKLVKKAKNIQHNLSKSVIETQPPPRRSSRQQAISGRKQDHEMEDCVFIDSSSEITPAAKRKTEKSKLRSLNDVLGKSCKAKSGPGQVKASVHGRNIKLTTGPVTIIDDSKDTSESSQDEEQFKAKREFLMSGLPDSLKRHIAKTAAALEAYSSASLCYRAVTHVQQKEEGVLMWKLLWPSTPLLTALRQPNAEVKDVTNLGFTLGTFTDARLKQEGVFANMLSGFRSSFSEVVTKCLLEEIKSCNSQFPVKRFLKQFLKRCTENCAFSSTNKEEIDSSSMCFSNSERENQGKTVEVADLGSKKRKAFSITEDKTMTQEVNPTVRESCSNTSDKGTIKGKTARASRKKQANDLLEKRKDCGVILIDGTTSAIKEPVCEDVLWTEKYQPQDSSELVGNSGAIKKLHSWLKEWKARADLEEKRSQKEKKPSENGQQDAWGQSDFEDDSENEEDDLLCNTVLITGPSGVGKTAAVYACASELGFKVFEVNASCQRSGRQILSQLKEATQSHQVDKQGANAHKPFLFNSTNTSKSPRKFNSPRRVVASPRKSPLVPRAAGMKRGLTPKSLETFFKTSLKDKSAEESLKQPKIRQRTCAYSIVQKEPSVAKEVSKPVEVAEESGRKSATSLILFEEVDVIFEDDLGFLNAIKTFMTTTKRPVILTTSDPSFGLQFDGFFEEIYFKSPSQINVASYLQTLCLAENLRTDVKDLYTLLSLNNCDIRQSVLFLQFWIRSGGGYLKDRTLSVCEKSDVETLPADGGEDAADFNMALPNLNFRLPKCDTGCVENFMGLQDILSPSEDLVSYIKCNIRKTQEWRKLVRLLQKFQMKNVNFIFNNLDLLLPMPVKILPGPNNASETEGENAQAVVPDATSLLKNVNIKPDGDCSPEVSPVKMSMRMKRKRKLGLLDDCDVLECDSNASEGFLTIPSHVPDAYDEAKSETTSAVEDLQQESLKKSVEKKLLSPAEKQCSILVSQCLDSICKFADDVSFLDGCLYTDAGDKYESINMEYNWTGGRIKNGVCDGCRVEHHEWWSTQCCGELKAIVEMLSFQSCYLNIAEAMESSLDLCKNLGKDPTDQLTLHVPKYRENVFFAQSAGHASLAKERLSLAKSVFSTGSLMTVGNRQASIIEYLPMLRNICKSEKFKEQGKMKRRYLHYFDGIHLELPKATLPRLAADFP